MAIVVTPLGAASVDGAFGGASPLVATGQTLGTGDVVLFATVDAAIGEVVQAPTIDTVLATSLGVSTDNLVSAWIAKGVATATGTISIPFSGSYNLVGYNWLLITGEDNASGVFTFFSDQSFGATGPQSVTGTVPTGGVGLVFRGDSNLTANPSTPTVWTGCVSANQTTLDSYVGTGNQIATGGNYTTTTGSVSPSANIINNSLVEMAMVTFGPAAGGGYVPYNPWPQMGPILAQKRRSTGWTPPLVDHRRRTWKRERGVLVPDLLIVRASSLKKAA